METAEKPKVKKRWVDIYSDEDISLSILRNLPKRNVFIGEDSHSFRNPSAQNYADDSYSGCIGRKRMCDASTTEVVDTKIASGFDRVMLALEGKNESVYESQHDTGHDTPTKNRADAYEDADKENSLYIKKTQPHRKVQLSGKSTCATKLSPAVSSPVSEMQSPYISPDKGGDACEWRRRDDTDTDHLPVGADADECDKDIQPHIHTYTHTELHKHSRTHANIQQHTHTLTTASTYEKRVNHRKKQLAVGKSSQSYKNYYRLIKPMQRKESDPHTPNPYSDVSKSRFDEHYAEWRRQLHRYDTLTQV